MNHDEKKLPHDSHRRWRESSQASRWGVGWIGGVRFFTLTIGDFPAC